MPMDPLWPELSFGLLRARGVYGPFTARRDFRAVNSSWCVWAHLLPVVSFGTLLRSLFWSRIRPVMHFSPFMARGAIRAICSP